MHYVDDAVQQQPVLLVERDVAHEGPVDLHQVHREVAQIVERRVAGAKVVDGQLAARLAQGIDPHPVLIAGLHQQGFGDLDDDVRRVQSEVVDHLEPLARLRIYGLELQGGAVDGHLQIREAGLLQPRQIPARLPQHQRPQPLDEPGLLRQRDEVRRRHLTPVRVIPAYQRLQLGDPAAAVVPDRLVGHGQLLELDRLRQILLHLVTLAHLFAHGGAVAAEQPSLPLGGKQRLFGVAQQLVALQAIARAEGDADGGRHVEVLVGQHEGAGEAADHLLGKHLGLAAVDDTGHQEGELVAADAGHQIFGAYPAHQPIRHLPQQGVTGMVIHAVIDRLEVVEVEYHQREALAPLAEAAEAAAEQPAVGQPGEIVVVGLGGDLLLRQLGLGEIAEDGDVLADPPPFPQGADHQLLGVELAVLALVPHLATPHPHPLQRVVHVGVEGLVVQARLEQAGALAAHLLLAVAGDLLERRVDRDDAAVGVAHQDRL